MKIALFVLLGLLGVVIGGAIIGGPQLQRSLASLRPEAPSTEVRTQQLAITRLVETVKAPGHIEPHTKVEISAEVSARIEELPFDVGDKVTKGDMVVKLDDKDLMAAVDSAEARSEGEAARLRSEQERLEGLHATLGYATKEVERLQSLFDTGDRARRDLDAALERVEDVQAQINVGQHLISAIESSLASAKADIDRAKEALAKTIIHAPMDGVILFRNAEVGEVVLVGTMNNPGTVILTVADLSRMLVKAEVAETDIARVAEGQTAKVHINAYRDLVFSGSVVQIALQRTEKPDGTGYFETEIEIDLRGEQIRSGGLANVDIEIAEHHGLALESQAIVDRVIEEMPDAVKRDNPLVDVARKTATVVYRVVNGKSVCTPVKRGASDDTHSLVLAGLSAGDVVIVGPFKVLEKIKHNEVVKDPALKPAADAATGKASLVERKDAPAGGAEGPEGGQDAKGADGGDGAQKEPAEPGSALAGS